MSVGTDVIAAPVACAVVGSHETQNSVGLTGGPTLFYCVDVTSTMMVTRLFTS